MENILYLANTPVTNSVRRYQPISYLVHDGAQGGIVVSPDLLFSNCLQLVFEFKLQPVLSLCDFSNVRGWTHNIAEHI